MTTEIEQQRQSSVPTLKRLNHRHRAIIDWILANPERSLGDCARALGYSQAWLSTVIGTDLFRDEFARRRAGLEEQEDREIVGKLRRVAKSTLDLMATRLESGANDGDPVSDQLLIQGSREALRALGYGGPARAQTHININHGQQQINNGAVDEGTLREAQEIYRRARGITREEPSDSEPHELPAPAGI